MNLFFQPFISVAGDYVVDRVAEKGRNDPEKLGSISNTGSCLTRGVRRRS